MRRVFGVGLFFFAWGFAACATGGGDVSFDGDDETGAGAGDTGTSSGAGGQTGTACTTDAYCLDFADDCNRGVCADGFCTTAPHNEGLDCEDDDPCTMGGSCSSGTCQGGGQIDCTALDDDCGVGVCDPTDGCIRQAANAGMSCDDGLFCTINDVCDSAGNCAGPDDYVCGAASSSCAANVCDEGAGACQEEVITACVSGDDCCPQGCTIAMDADCDCSTNHALVATPSSSGGASAAGYLPDQMNNVLDESSCSFHWIDNDTSPSGAFIEYQWSSSVTIGSIYVDTAPAGSNPCTGSSGRNMFSGSVEWWDGAGWVSSTTFTGQTGDLSIDLPTPVTTTRLRIYNITTSSGNGNSMIFEWYVYPVAGCTP